MHELTAEQSITSRVNSRISSAVDWWKPIPAEVTPRERRSYNMMIVGQPTTLAAHILFLFLFIYWDMPALALFNILSVLLWSASILLLHKHKLSLAIWVGTIEVVAHTILVVYFVGWGMGIQYYLVTLILGMSVCIWPLWTRIIGVLATTALFVYLYYYALGNPPLYHVDPFQLNIINTLVTFSAILLSTAMMLYSASNADVLEIQLELEHEKSEALLHNVLPEVIIDRLKDKQGTIADLRQSKAEGIAEGFNDVTVLFADVVGFTPMSEQLTPQATVDILNEIFSYFDMLAEKYGVEKIRTIGDGYMVAAGAPLPRADHAQVLVQMALEMQQYMEHRQKTTDVPLEVRIGINSGSAVAGIVGTTKFHYDLWGDMVNTASRMESHGQPGKIQIARPTYELIKNNFTCESQGSLEVKGKGEMDVWFVTGITGESSEIADLANLS